MLCRCVPALFPINDMKAPGRSGAGGKRNHRERVGILPDESRALPMIATGRSAAACVLQRGETFPQHEREGEERAEHHEEQYLD